MRSLGAKEEERFALVSRLRELLNAGLHSLADFVHELVYAPMEVFERTRKSTVLNLF